MDSYNTIAVSNLDKSFNGTQVLKGVSLSVERGKILGLLGPNGAGKTTTVRILSTLIKPDGGQVFINGYDVVKEPNKVRSNIGLTGQYAAVDEYLTGEENLYMIGRLYRLAWPTIKKRSGELLDQLELGDVRKKIVKTYSGGMRRKLDLAMSLIASPPVLFLDEPTTGLDPRSRLTMWEIIRQLAATDVTILLTTQYMEEADYLADSVVVIDDGRVIAQGTPLALKAQIGSERLELTISRKSSFVNAAKAVNSEHAHIDENLRLVSVPTKGGVGELKDILSKLEQANVEVESVSLHRPTLDDVFISLTGRQATQEQEQQ